MASDSSEGRSIAKIEAGEARPEGSMFSAVEHFVRLLRCTPRSRRLVHTIANLFKRTIDIQCAFEN